MAGMRGGGKGQITVQEAGRKGGETTSNRYGRGFYHDIGTKGGHRVRDLINEAKRMEEEGGGGQGGGRRMRGM